MRTVLLLTALFLGGCGTTHEMVQVPKTVEVPVPVLCKTADPVIPMYHFKPPYDATFNGTKDLMGDREQALAYEIEMRAGLKSCK